VPGEWLVDERVAAPAELHASWPAAEQDPGVKWLAVCHPTRPAIVLGSTQPSDVVDAEAARAAGIDVVRRRSGGGAVLVTPDDPVWVDLWLPVGDARWSADVTVAFGWVGAAWAAALDRVGLAGLEVQGSGPGACTRWTSLVCFGGVGAGEVSIGGRKVVGLAQRRNRSGVWFHTACVRHWDPRLLVEMLDLPPEQRAAAVDGLAGAVTGVADEVTARGRSAPSAADLFTAFFDSLA
jgi:lipoate-protein ligase A